MFLSLILWLCQYEGFCSFYRNIYKTTTAWVAHVCLKAIQLTVSYLRFIVFLSRMHVPVMRWKFLSCPWNAVKNRMSLVVLTAYLHCSDAFTRCRHTGIHLLYFCTPDFIIWGLGSKVKATYEILVLFIVNIIQAELLYILGKIS